MKKRCEMTPAEIAKDLARGREYRRRNLERCRQATLRWMEDHPERVAEYKKKFHAAHPNYYREWRAKRRARLNPSGNR